MEGREDLTIVHSPCPEITCSFAKQLRFSDMSVDLLASSRRTFIQRIAAFAAASSVFPFKAIGATGAACSVAGQPSAAQAPEVSSRRRFRFLPLTSIKPTGWLKSQLQIQASGLTGHLEEIWPDVGPNSGWLGGKGESWERGPYYLDGLVPLAYLLDDEALKYKARKWIEWTLCNQQPNGMIGPTSNDDWWPRMVMTKVLTQYHEATGDDRVISVLGKYFEYQRQEMPRRPLRDWGKFRWHDEALSVLWLHERTRDPKLLELAHMLHDQGHDWERQFANFDVMHKLGPKDLGSDVDKDWGLKDRALQNHGVNNAMGLKAAPVWWLLTGDPADRQAFFHQLDMLQTYHGQPNGMFAADEHLAGRNPSQGTELCAVVETMFSLEQAVEIFGDPVVADLLERIAYNALPGTFTDDMWAHQYDQQCNQIRVSHHQRDWTSNGPDANLFGLEPNFGCCTANMHQGWPKLASSLWMATPARGLAAAVYAPCEVTTTVADRVPIHIVQRTEYPFHDTVTIELKPAKAVRFPLELRIPVWAEGASYQINNGTPRAATVASFASIDRVWRPGDRVQLRLPMRPRTSRWFNDSVAVERGPLLFSLAVSGEWTKVRDRGPASDWAVKPTGPWNYSLEIDPAKAVDGVRVEHRPAETHVFTAALAPVAMHVKGHRLAEWTEVNGSAAPPPQGPVSSNAPAEELKLVPYAAAKLRVTAFPLQRS
jgi:hypothetical protein